MRVLAKPQQIRLFAARKNLAEYEVAAKVGLTRQQFGQVLVGASSMRPGARRKLQRLLGAQFEDLFEIVDAELRRA